MSTAGLKQQSWLSEQLKVGRRKLLGLASLLLLAGPCTLAQQPVNVQLVFSGVSQDTFEQQLAKGCAAAVAASAGVPLDFVSIAGRATALLETSSSKPISKFAQASTPGRKLSQGQAVAEYAIRTNRSMGDWAAPEVVRAKLLASAAGFGQASADGFGRGFYTNLEKNGVMYQPSVFMDNILILAGGLTADAPKSKFGNRTTPDDTLFDPEAILTLDEQQQRQASRAAALAVQNSKNVSQTPSNATKAASAGAVIPPWAIAIIVMMCFLFVAASSVYVWRRVCRGSNMSNDGSQFGREQFIAQAGEP